jgi:hypothetical protein
MLWFCYSKDPDPQSAKHYFRGSQIPKKAKDPRGSGSPSLNKSVLYFKMFWFAFLALFSLFVGWFMWKRWKKIYIHNKSYYQLPQNNKVSINSLTDSKGRTTAWNPPLQVISIRSRFGGFYRIRIPLRRLDVWNHAVMNHIWIFCNLSLFTSKRVWFR